MCIVSDELQARTFGVKNLTATGHKAWQVRLSWADGVRDANIGRLRIGLGQLPGHPPSLGVERQPDTPHDAGAVWICKGLVLAYQLDGDSAGSSGGLQVIVKVEVLVWPTDV